MWDDKKNVPFAKEHFRMIDNSVFLYDFHIDSLSTARGIANEEYAAYYSVDVSGVQRPLQQADAGCYQFVPATEE